MDEDALGDGVSVGPDGDGDFGGGVSAVGYGNGDEKVSSLFRRGEDVGNGQVGTQPVNAVSDLPPSIQNAAAQGSGQTGQTNSSSSSNTGLIVGAVVGVVAAIGILGALAGILVARRRRASSRQHPSASYAMGATRAGFGTSGAASLSRHADDVRHSNSSAFVPLQQDNPSMAWNASTASLHSAYRDDHDGRPHYDPYNSDAIGRSSMGLRL